MGLGALVLSPRLWHSFMALVYGLGLRCAGGRAGLWPRCECSLYHTTTLTDQAIAAIKRLGYRVIVDIPADLPEQEGR